MLLELQQLFSRKKQRKKREKQCRSTFESSPDSSASPSPATSSSSPSKRHTIGPREQPDSFRSSQGEGNNARINKDVDTQRSTQAMPQDQRMQTYRRSNHDGSTMDPEREGRRSQGTHQTHHSTSYYSPPLSIPSPPSIVSPTSSYTSRPVLDYRGQSAPDYSSGSFGSAQPPSPLRSRPPPLPNRPLSNQPISQHDCSPPAHTNTSPNSIHSSYSSSKMYATLPSPPTVGSSRTNVKQVILSRPVSPVVVHSSLRTPVPPGGFPIYRPALSPTPPRRSHLPPPQPQRPQSYSHRPSPHPSTSYRYSQPHLSALPSSISAPAINIASRPLANHTNTPRSTPSIRSSPLTSPLKGTPPSTPTKSRHSSNIIDSSPTHKNRCRGTVASGKRCMRLVATEGTTSSPGMRSRGGSPSKEQWSDVEVMLRLSEAGEGGIEVGEEEEEVQVAVFCHSHRANGLRDRGCFITGHDGKGEWIEFDDWISPTLSPSTQLLLRHEMSRPLSPADTSGYIYIHEMVERKRSTTKPSMTAFIKVGRSISPISRLSQWRSSCPSREVVVRDILPRAPGVRRLNPGLGVTIRINPEGVQYHHRWERLLLIEIAGRAEMESASVGGGRVRSKCVDCGKSHCELFEVGATSLEEWVVEVVEKWMKYVDSVLV